LGEKIGLDLKNKVLPKAGSYLNSGKIDSRILCLYGDLGGGKTTFIQGLAKGLGIKRRVTSPTFVFMKQYQPSFYHVDLYRVNNVKEAKGLGLGELFNDSRAIVAIEWAERIKEILPKKRIDIYFDYVSENQRKITFKK
jgi:tRNA threonylcarbamoyladenosine biosynthesis protein TsaE